MRISIISGLSGLFLSLAAASGAPGDFDQLVNAAQTALTKLDLDSARASLSKACQPEIAASGTSAKTAICETETGAIEEAAHQPEAAEAHYGRALSIWTRLAPRYATLHAATLMNLGNLYRTQHRRAEAEDVLTRAFALVRTELTTSAGNRLAALVNSRLGGFYTESTAPERGRAMLNQAISMLRTPGLSNPVELAGALNSLGVLNLRAGAYSAGESNLREAVTVATEALGESHPDTALCEANLALALQLQGQYSRAEVLLKRARYIIETRLSPGSTLLGTILANLAAVESTQGEFPRAEADAAQYSAILTRQYGPESPEAAPGIVMLAAVYLSERKIAEAEKILPAAIALERRFAGDSRMFDTRVLADGTHRLGELRALQRNWQEARTLYSEAIAIYESALGPGHPGIAPMLQEYAEVLKHSGAPKAEVKNIEARARATKA